MEFLQACRNAQMFITTQPFFFHPPPFAVITDYFTYSLHALSVWDCLLRHTSGLLSVNNHLRFVLWSKFSLCSIAWNIKWLHIDVIRGTKSMNNGEILQLRPQKHKSIHLECLLSVQMSRNVWICARLITNPGNFRNVQLGPNDMIWIKKSKKSIVEYFYLIDYKTFLITRNKILSLIYLSPSIIFIFKEVFYHNLFLLVWNLYLLFDYFCQLWVIFLLF